MIYVNGCSYTSGTKYSISKSRYAWPYRLGKLLGKEVFNRALEGGSNDRILRTTIQDVIEMNPEMVIIQWSGSERFETPVDNWLQHRPYSPCLMIGVEKIPHQDFYKKCFWPDAPKNKKQFSNIVDNECDSKQLSQMLAVNSFVRDTMGIRCIHLLSYKIKNNRMRKIMESFCEMAHDSKMSITQILHDNNIVVTNNPMPSPYGSNIKYYDAHFGKDGHQFQANLLFDYITKNKLISTMIEGDRETDRTIHHYNLGQRYINDKSKAEKK